MAQDLAPASRFFFPDRRLGQYVQFGFLLSDYRPRGGSLIQRLPTARATIYYAADVRHETTGQPSTGLFCEGPHGRGFEVFYESGELVAVKVRPGALWALLGVPAKELRDLTLPLEELWGRSATIVAEQMAAAPSARQRAGILQSELARRCQAFDRHDFIALAVSRSIERRAGNVRVQELIEQSGYSQRTLLQKFDDWVGLTPKQQARLTRLRAAAVRLSNAADRCHADVALECGFCDEAHMIHDFHDLIGLSPSRFIEQRLSFSPIGAQARGQSAVPRREQELYRLLGQVTWTSGRSTR